MINYPPNIADFVPGSEKSPPPYRPGGAISAISRMETPPPQPALGAPIEGHGSEKRQPTYAIEAVGGNRFNVVGSLRTTTVVAKELRWEEAVSLADELNEE